MEAEGPSSSPRGDPQADADAAATTVSSDELMRRLALSESVNLELERALEVKARSLDEATRAVEHLRRELRGAMAANDADGSVPAAAMVFGIYVLPESPRWLVSRGRETQAVESLQKLGFPPEEVDAQLCGPGGSPGAAQLVAGPLVMGVRCLQPQGFPGFCYVFPKSKTFPQVDAAVAERRQSAERRLDTRSSR